MLGPVPYPLVGNSPQLFNQGRSNEDIYIKWRRQFGDVYTIWVSFNKIYIYNRLFKYYAVICELKIGNIDLV